MSAEMLRKAATLMRERAEAATGVTYRWHQRPNGVGKGQVLCGAVRIAATDETLSDTADNAAHIASWHPAVALAVADWLDAAYDDEVRFAAQGAHGFPGENPAFAVARAYLGEAS